jgi:hypothetical protein
METGIDLADRNGRQRVTVILNCAIIAVKDLIRSNLYRCGRGFVRSRFGLGRGRRAAGNGECRREAAQEEGIAEAHGSLLKRSEVKTGSPRPTVTTVIFD